MKKKRGIALIVSFMSIMVLTILGALIFSRSVNERFNATRYVESTQAFWLAEAGINRALNELRGNFTVSGNSLWSGTLGNGRYSVDVANVVGESGKKRVTAHGFVPAVSSRVERIVEAMMAKEIPPNFYDSAIYSGGDIDIKGNSYSITGDVAYADDLTYTSDNISGTETEDPTINPLARLDFVQLREIAVNQGNLYTEARLADVAKKQESFPASFWNVPPTDPNDPSTGVPNVIYCEGDLKLNGDIGTIGGFFVVAGDVITSPDASSDFTIEGNGKIEGSIYTRGTFRVNGGGSAGKSLSVDGGVWAGELARLNGNVNIGYQSDYVDAIKALNINPDVQIASWRDTQSPYKFSP